MVCPKRNSVTAALLRVICAGLLALPVYQASAAPTLVTTIKPLQFIAQAITAGISTPELILSAGQDPHEIVLRPSDRRLLASAQLLLWVGPALELPLAELVAELPAQTLTVQELPDIQLLAFGTSVDPHIWLSLHNAGVIATALAQKLSQLDPDQAQAYHANLDRFQLSLADLMSGAAQRFSRSPVKAWAVYHHAFQYPQDELGLPAPLAVTDSNNNTPGIRGLRLLRQQVQQQALDCLLAEPGIDAGKVRSMLDMPALTIMEVDIMGTSQALTADGYIQLYKGVLEAIGRCSKGVQHD